MHLRPVYRNDYFQYYWTEGKKNSTKLLAIMLLISILFSNLHVVWVYDPQDLITRSVRGMVYAFAFVLTNKKIYLPWILHYINNILTDTVVSSSLECQYRFHCTSYLSG